jgi:hypothetical protein
MSRKPKDIGDLAQKLGVDIATDCLDELQAMKLGYQVERLKIVQHAVTKLSATADSERAAVGFFTCIVGNIIMRGLRDRP